MKPTTALPTEETEPNWRFETKYRVSTTQYLALRNAIKPYLQPDPFTKYAPDHRYLVRSLYFDTRDFKLYNEKIDGVCNRMKFRIRTYGKNREALPDIRVEIKVRKGNIIEKYGAFINHEHYANFMHSQAGFPLDDPVLMEFTRYVHKWNLLPQTLVQYHREGYQSRAHEALRLTFDHHIVSASTRELFPDTIFWHRHHLSQVVLEIKHKSKVPLWVNALVQDFGLKVLSNSKYTNSIEIAKRTAVDSSIYFLSG